MPTTTFPEYARKISDVLSGIIDTGKAQLVSFQTDQRSTLRGYISGMLLFDDNSELHFREFIDLTQSEPKLTYAYHYQDANKALIFRYDNAAHHPPLSQCKHKHTATGAAISPTPKLEQVIDEIFN